MSEYWNVLMRKYCKWGNIISITARTLNTSLSLSASTVSLSICWTMSGRKYVQLLASLAANLCQAAVGGYFSLGLTTGPRFSVNIVSAGHCVPMSAYILPQLTSGNTILVLSEWGNAKLLPGDDSLRITEQEGSWFGITPGCNFIFRFLKIEF